MGFSSIEAKALVEQMTDKNLLGHGAGHIVYKISKLQNLDIRTAGLELIDGKHWEEVDAAFEKVGK